MIELEAKLTDGVRLKIVDRDETFDLLIEGQIDIDVWGQIDRVAFVSSELPIFVELITKFQTLTLLK